MRSWPPLSSTCTPSPATFEFQAKAAQLNMRLPQTLLEAVKDQAKARGMPYTRFIRETLERAVSSAR